MTEPAFVPPAKLAELIALAVAHRRSFVLQHSTPAEEATSGGPFVTFRAMWLPPDCDVATELRLSWHTRATGSYRLFSSTARGLHHDWHAVTAAAAASLLKGEQSFASPEGVAS